MLLRKMSTDGNTYVGVRNSSGVEAGDGDVVKVVCWVLQSEVAEVVVGDWLGPRQ